MGNDIKKVVNFYKNQNVSLNRTRVKMSESQKLQYMLAKNKYEISKRNYEELKEKYSIKAKGEGVLRDVYQKIAAIFRFMDRITSTISVIVNKYLSKLSLAIKRMTYKSFRRDKFIGKLNKLKDKGYTKAVVNVYSGDSFKKAYKVKLALLEMYEGLFKDTFNKPINEIYKDIKKTMGKSATTDNFFNPKTEVEKGLLRVSTVGSYINDALDDNKLLILGGYIGMNIGVATVNPVITIGAYVAYVAGLLKAMTQAFSDSDHIFKEPNYKKVAVELSDSKQVDRIVKYFNEMYEIMDEINSIHLDNMGSIFWKMRSTIETIMKAKESDVQKYMDDASINIKDFDKMMQNLMLCVNIYPTIVQSVINDLSTSSYIMTSLKGVK